MPKDFHLPNWIFPDHFELVKKIPDEEKDKIDNIHHETFSYDDHSILDHEMDDIINYDDLKNIDYDKKIIQPTPPPPSPEPEPEPPAPPPPPPAKIVQPPPPVPQEITVNCLRLINYDDAFSTKYGTFYSLKISDNHIKNLDVCNDGTVYLNYFKKVKSYDYIKVCGNSKAKVVKYKFFNRKRFSVKRKCLEYKTTRGFFHYRYCVKWDPNVKPNILKSFVNIPENYFKGWILADNTYPQTIQSNTYYRITINKVTDGMLENQNIKLNLEVIQGNRQNPPRKKYSNEGFVGCHGWVKVKATGECNFENYYSAYFDYHGMGGNYFWQCYKYDIITGKIIQHKLNCKSLFNPPKSGTSVSLPITSFIKPETIKTTTYKHPFPQMFLLNAKIAYYRCPTRAFHFSSNYCYVEIQYAPGWITYTSDFLNDNIGVTFKDVL